MAQLQRLVNSRRGTILAHELHPSAESSRRLRHLTLRRKFPIGVALWLSPCRAIHTLGLRFPIDAIFLDDKLRVIETRECIPPGSLVRPVPRASSVVELPAGTVRASGTEVGDSLDVEPVKIVVRTADWIGTN